MAALVAGGRARRTCSVIMCKFYSLYLITVYGLAASAAQSGANGCVLPPYPPQGTYTVYNKPDALPGQTYDLAILTVTCDPGYGLVGNNDTYCFSNNNWQQPMPRCTRFCRLTPDPSVNYFCKASGDDIRSGTRKCHEMEPDGTVVVPECNRPVYYSTAVLRNMRCFEGTWDHVAVCQPDCGILTPQGQGLIINGTRTAHGEFPWHAAIYDKTYTPIQEICGGSLVSTKLIISAAHCFWKDSKGQQPASRYAVALGKIYRGWDQKMDPGAHKSEVSEIKVPQRFYGGATLYQDDIAILIMKTPVVYVTHIRPVCFDLSEEFDRSQLKSSHSGKISVWDLTSTDGRETSVLMTAELTYVDVGVCLDEVSDDFRPYVTSDKFCAGSKGGKTVCRGDGGGGLVFPQDDRGIRRYYLRGVASTKPTDDSDKCNANSYVTFTRILRHSKFIKDNWLAAGAAQNGPAGCVLPPYPPHGTYAVYNRPEAVAGQTYDYASLTVTCDPGYGVVGSNITYCFGGNIWLQPLPQCTRFCRLTRDPSVNYMCRISGEGIFSGTRQCNELEPDGTVVVPECNSPVYYTRGVLLNMRCVQGNWDHIAVCQPDCGTFTPVGEGLIINGTRVKHGELPWHAAIYDKTYTPFKQICGGSLISTKVVISAAHCFWEDATGQQPASRYAVALGKIYRPWNNTMDPGVHHSQVSEIKIPVRFMSGAGNYQADIALVVMATKVVYVTYIRPVCLDFDVEFDRSQLQNTNTGRVSGWGLTSEDGVASQELLTTELSYVDVEKCIANLPVSFRPYITGDKICAGGNGTTACRGDSGGGLAFPHLDRGTRWRYFLRGVVSTAPPNGHECNANSYVTFTHILSHATFIIDYGLDIVSVNYG